MPSYKLGLFVSIFAICLTGASRAQAAPPVRASCAEHAQVDAELNQVYAQVARAYSADKQFIAKLKLAQRAWLAFTAAHLAAHYPDPDPATYGSVHRTCRCLVMTDLTRERITQLRQWLHGTAEGDVCAGSIKRHE